MAQHNTAQPNKGTGDGIIKSPQGTLGKPRNFEIFFWILGYLWDLGSNIKVFGQNNVFFQLLQQK